MISLRFLPILTLLLFAFSTSLLAQPATPPADGEYRSAGAVDFVSPTNWEIASGGAWSAASTPPDGTKTITIQSGNVVTVNTALVVTGYIKNLSTSAFVFSGGSITFSNGSTYEHAVDGGAFPAAASTTWGTGSTCLISGLNAATSFTNFTTQNFYNLTWNNPAQGTAAVNNFGLSLANINSNNGSIAGNFTVISTGLNSSTIRLVALSNGVVKSLTVGGNINVLGGTITTTGSGGPFTTATTGMTVNINGDINLSGGTINLIGSSAAAAVDTWNLNGDLVISGGTLSVGNLSPSSSFNFTKGSLQTFNRTAGTLVNVPFVVPSTSIVALGSSVIDGGCFFTVNPGGTIQTTHVNGFAGNIATTGTRNYSATTNYVFNGSSAQNIISFTNNFYARGGIVNGSTTVGFSLFNAGVIPGVAISGTGISAGTTISSASSAISLSKTSGAATSSSTTLTVTDATGIVPGLAIATTAGVSLGIITQISGTTLTLSASATVAAATPLTITGQTVVISAAATASTTTSTNNYTLPLAAVNAAGTLSINNAAGVTLKTSLTPTVINLSTGTFTIGDGASLPGSLTLTANGSTIGATSILKVLNNGIANFAGKTVTIKSTSVGTGSIGTIAVGGSLSNATNVTVERFIGSPTAKRAWRLVTAPLRGTTNNSVYNTWQENGAQTIGNGTLVTGPSANPSGNGLDVTSGNSLKSFDGTNLVGVNNTKTTALFDAGSGTTAGNKGFFLFVRGDRSSITDLNNVSQTTLRATGTLQTGDQVFATNATANGFTLLANPYPSSVDFDLFRQDNTASNMKPNYYYWDPNAATVGVYGVASWNGSSYDYTGAATINTTTIPSGAAFFVQTKSDASGAASVTFKETHKTAGTANILARQGNQTEKIDVKLQLDDNGTISVVDGILARFNNNYTALIGDDDAGKLPNIGENIAFVRNGLLLSIEGHPLVDNNDTLFIQMSNMKQARNYSFAINAGNFNAPALSAFLEDSYLNSATPIDLTGATTANFSTPDAASLAANRFRIVFRSNSTLPVSYVSVKAYQKNTGVQVDWNIVSETNIRNYEVERSGDGRSFSSVGTVSANAGSKNDLRYGWFDASPMPGANYYRIKAIDNYNAGRFSNIVSIKVGGSSSGITLYPNPVIGNTISLQFENEASGVYTVKLINNLAQVVWTRSVEHTGGSATQTFCIGNNVNKGLYHLEVTNGETKYSQQVLCQ